MLLSILIPFRDHPELLNQCLASLEKFPFQMGDWEIVLIDNGSAETSLAKIHRPPDLDIKELRVDEPFNFQRLNNAGAEIATGEVLLLLNNDTEAVQAGWLEALYLKAREANVGAVGCLLLYPDQTIQHGGVVVGLNHYAEHLYRNAHLDEKKLLDIAGPTEDRPISAVTAACLAVERSKFDLVGGMDEEFIICGGDVDLCLRLAAAGFVAFYLGSVRAIHHESKSRKRQAIPPSDFRKSEESYSTYLQGRPDPYYPDFLSRHHTKPRRLLPPAGKIGSKWQNFSRKRRQFVSALHHGGLRRLLQISSERRGQGYSTRARTYAWPKDLLLKVEPLLAQKRHYFIPHLNAAKAYGGLATVVKLAVDEARKGAFVNFVLVDDEGDFESIARIAKISDTEWKEIGHRFSARRFDDTDTIHLTTSPFDTFVATAWWTKLTLDSAKLAKDRLTYIIQDYEALFYDETDAVENELRQLADESYRQPCHVRINSKFLADFLFQKHVLKAWELPSVEIFEPMIDPTVFFEDPAVPKLKQLFVYARPEIGRNRFDLCLEALREAAPKIPKDWQIFGLGSLQTEQDLGGGHILKPLGKLPFKDYVEFMKRTPLGLCLMESPHPSYPPLELAACGALVVCNRYANKDYAQISRRFLCSELTGPLIAQNLIKGATLINAAFEASP